MWTQLKDVTKKTVNALWCHKTVYAILAVTYFAGFAGWLDKSSVSLIAAGCYLLLCLMPDH